LNHFLTWEGQGHMDIISGIRSRTIVMYLVKVICH